jgi:hypothetical protein
MSRLEMSATSAGKPSKTAEEAWETRVFDASTVTSVDVFTSVWGNPNIAHVMVSFGFADGRHIAFSAETRRRKGQVYSTLGGFVREFELTLLAADERDLIWLRTDLRGERVSIFPADPCHPRRGVSCSWPSPVLPKSWTVNRNGTTRCWTTARRCRCGSCAP